MKRRIRCFTVALLLFGTGYTFNGYSQDFNSDYFVDSDFTLDQWTIEDGLPVNSVNQILQTSEGYLWLATFDGLVRFDGVRFKVYKSADYPGLPSNRIQSMANSADDVLWLQLEGDQLVKFENEEFELIDSTKGLNGEQVYCFYKPENSDELLLCSSNGISRYKEGNLTAYHPEKIEGAVTYIYIDEENTLWYKKGTNQSLHRFDGNTSTYLGAAGELTFTTPVISLNDGSTLFSTIGHINRYINGEVKELPLDLPSDFMVLNFYKGDIYFDGFEKGDVLVATLEHGLFKLSEGTLSIVEGEFRGTPRATFEEGNDQLWLMGEQHILNNGKIIFSFNDVTRQKIYDHEGSFWFGSQSAGLFRLKPNLFSIYSEKEGLPDRNIYPVYEASDGAIWAGTHGHGAVRLKHGKIHSYKIASSTGSYVRSILETNDGNILMSLLDKGLFKLNKNNNKFEKIKSPSPQPYLVSIFSVDALFEDSNEQIWAGTTHGLYRQPKDSSEWIRLPDEVSNPRNYVRYFAEAPDSSLWMATAGGGIKQYQNGIFTTYTTEKGLSSNRVRSLYIDTASATTDGYVLWVGTEDKGLNRIEINEGGSDLSSIAVYNEQIGLYDNVVHQILEDNDGRLWMSGNKGIYWVSKKELNDFHAGTISSIQSKSYTEEDGLRNREANGGIQPAGTKSSDGRIWFPTQDGLVSVDPRNISQNEVPPPVQIEEVKSMGNELPLTNNGLAELDPNQRDFEINYTGLSFMVPEKVIFRYRLNGFNDKWIDAGPRRTAFFTNVPPGSYEFEVLAANNAGVWNQKPATLSLTISPYFYETKLFYFIIAVLVGLIILGIFKVRTSQLKNRQKELEQSVAERTKEINQQKETIEKQANAQKRFFANVSHELRTPLTLSIGPLEDLRSAKPSLPETALSKVTLALRNSKRLLSLVSQILDISRLEASENKLLVTQQNLTQFVKAISQNFSSLASRSNISYKVEAPEKVIAWFNPDQIEKVITNLLSNAFKFTGDEGNISIKLTQKNETAVIKVMDTGMGIPEAELKNIFDRFYQSSNSSSRLQHGTGIGLALVKSLVELHGGTIIAESKIGIGTTFIIHLPLKANTLSHAEEVKNSNHEPGLFWEVMEEADISKQNMSSALDDEDRTTVLIVEDNLELRQFVVGHLRERYRVIEAIHGKEGLEKAKKYLPDLIISDVMMPEMDGFEMVEHLRKDTAINFIPVIMLTGKDTKEDTLKGLEFGANDYIIKPFDMDELMARIKSTLRSQKLLRAKFESEASVIKVDKNKLKSADQKFIDQIRKAILENLEDSSLSVEKLAEMVNVGRTTLHRKLTNIAGETPVQLIRRIRLEQGKFMIENNVGTISEIAYSVGFESISWFSKCFKEHYKMSPSEFLS